MDLAIFGKNDISRQQFLLAKFSQIVSSFTRDQFESAISDEYFGNKPNYDSMNDFNYLFVLLLIIDNEMNFDLSTGNTAPWYDKIYYIEKYRLEDVRKHFKCMGYDITPLLSLIELNDAQPPSGIDHMYIEGNPQDANAEVFVVS